VIVDVIFGANDSLLQREDHCFGGRNLRNRGSLRQASFAR